MKPPIATAAPDLAARLNALAARRTVLFMTDYDGTLVPIAAQPHLARPSAAVPRLLSALAGRPGFQVAVVSGRSLADLCDFLPVPAIYRVGEHGGATCTPDGHVQWAVDRDRIDPVLAELAAVAQGLIGERPGWLLERKALALAVHFRLAAPAGMADVLRAIAAAWAPLIELHHLELLHGNQVLEVRPGGLNKGLACTALMDRWPEACPVFLGDDTTDEDAFRAVATGAAEPLTVLVGAQRPTQAYWHLPGPADVIRLLEILTANGGSEHR